MENINTQKRYIFKKEYKTKFGTIPIGSQIDEFRGQYYINGGMCDQYSQGLFCHIINNKTLKDEYLKEVVIPINKI